MLRRLLGLLVGSSFVLLVILLSFLVDSYLPFALPAIPAWISWIILLTGLSLIVLGEWAFLTRGGATGAPTDPTKRLVTTGIYRWVRNPIYLGGALVLLGVSLFRNSPTLFLAAYLFLPITHFTVVRREEKQLERDFGSEYKNYKRKVSRWIPKPPG